MNKEGFRSLSLSLLTLGLLLLGRDLQVRNLTSTCLFACWLGCSGHTFPSAEPLWMPGAHRWGGLQCTLGTPQAGLRLPNSPTSPPPLPHLWAPISPGPAQRPPPCFPSHSCPCHSSAHSNQSGLLKMSSCWSYSPVALLIRGFLSCLE